MSAPFDKVWVVLSEDSKLLRKQNGERAIYWRRRDAEDHKKELLFAGCSRGFVRIESVDLYAHQDSRDE